VASVVMLASRVPAGCYRAEGMIKNVNTIEEYKEIDKITMLQQAGKTVRCSCSLLDDHY
jgi:ubiquitin-like modifier-activating enzyme ATG7